MINNQDKEDKEIEALSLIDRAETLADQGNGSEAINLYEKAAQIYLDIGSYIKLDELYIKISTIISQFKNNIQAIYRLKSIIRKTEELNLYEISAKLLIQLGNYSSRMQDWETAGESWAKASDYLYEIDPEEYYNLSSILLIKAGQALEYSSQQKDEAERLILKAVMKINKFEELYQMEEKRAMNLISMEEFQASANKFYEISKYFRKAMYNLDELSAEIDPIEVYKNAKARLLHLTAEYRTIAALCLRASENRKFNEQIKNIGNNVIELVKEAITLLKELSFSKSYDFDKEDILRMTFDTLLLSVIQEMLGEKKINPIEFLFENLNDKSLMKKLKKSPYYEITEQIEKVGILESLEKLDKIHLGHMDKVKKIVIPYFTKT